MKGLRGIEQDDWSVAIDSLISKRRTWDFNSDIDQRNHDRQWLGEALHKQQGSGVDRAQLIGDLAFYHDEVAP